jgi:hypothetical protein
MIISNENNRDILADKFHCFALYLCNSFPELDLRFNYQEGTTYLRYLAPDVSSHIFEVEIVERSMDEIVLEAILNIKEIAKLFDA